MGYWLITTNQKTFCIDTNTFNSWYLQISEWPIKKQLAITKYYR